MKYHPECPQRFETVQDVVDWVSKFQKLYNDHPHSSLGYVRPNEEHAGLGNVIRQARKENLMTARQNRLSYYHSQKRQVLDYGSTENRVCNNVLCQNTEPLNHENGSNVKIGPLEPFKNKEDFRNNSSEILCQNR